MGARLCHRKLHGERQREEQEQGQRDRKGTGKGQSGKHWRTPSTPRASATTVGKARSTAQCTKEKKRGRCKPGVLERKTTR